MPQAQPELKKVRLPAHLRQYPDTNRGHGTQYMEKRLFVQLNGNRKVIGVLRGYDVRDIPSWLFSIHTQRARARTLRVTGRHGWLTIRAQVFMNNIEQRQSTLLRIVLYLGGLCKAKFFLGYSRKLRCDARGTPNIRSVS